MYTLAFESSAKAASTALACDGRLISQYFQSSGLTHSRTLLPMALDMLKNCELAISDIDVFAVSHGPGSFTGVRIGVSTVKGLCWGADKPAIGVSTLEAMAWNGECAAPGSVICCAMDARRSQVYNALFEFENGRPRRLCSDRAVSLEELAEELRQCRRSIFVVGDGAELCCGYFMQRDIDAVLAPEAVRLQNAWGVCRAVEGKAPQGADKLLPVYLRLSQAERERQERINWGKT